MQGAHEFLQTLALVFCVAAVTTVIFQRLRQPVVLGYLLAGIAIGPYFPIPLAADTRTVNSISELGVVMLMFVLGIEFSLPKLIRVGHTIAFIAIVEVSFVVWLGYSAGQAFGWPPLVSFYAGAILASASTTIIVKAFNEEGIRGEFTHIVFGVLLFDDLIAILLIVILTTLSAGQELTSLELAKTIGRLGLFLLVLLIIGLLTVPRIMRSVVSLRRTETTVVASVGLAFGFAFLAAAAGYSVALGAFLAGSLVAESGVEQRVSRIVEPVRDIFAAIFFVSVGMLIDPAQIIAHWHIVLVFLAAVVFGRVLAVSASTFLTGQSVQTAVKAGMSMAQIGEFSFIIASVGLATKGTGEQGQLLFSVAVAVSGITIMLTPWMIRAAEPTAKFIDRKLPRPLQTFASLYGSWMEGLRAGPADEQNARVQRLLRWLLVDAVLVAAVIIGASVEMDNISNWAQSHLQIPEQYSRIVVVFGAIAVSCPFWIGLIRVARYLGFELSQRAFPKGADRVDLAAAPRRLLVVTLQLAIILVIGLPLLAVTQPFLPPFRGALLLVVLLAVLAISFWRSATNMQGHTRAAAQAIAETLANQTRKGRAAHVGHVVEAPTDLLAGLGSPVSIQLGLDSSVIGKTLAEVNLRGLTGATVIAIQRDKQSVVMPSGHEQLQAGDVLALAGTQDAIEAAQQVLASRAAG